MRSLAARPERLGGELVVHDRFGTAVVRSQAATFDVVTARTETYAAPGALPEVRPGATIEEDLARRDFTVNAIALRIADGALAEWPGARADLAAGVLRVLHERSFEDDPTRLLRMARYGARLGFEPDPDTDALAAAATVETVSGGRLGSELRLLLREPQPAALLALERHGLGRAVVHPGFSVSPALRHGARSTLCPADARADLVALATTLAGERAAIARGRARPARVRCRFTRGIVPSRPSRRGAFLCDLLERTRTSTTRELWRALRRQDPRGRRGRGRSGRRRRGGRALARPTSATGGWRSPATTSWRRA